MLTCAYTLLTVTLGALLSGSLPVDEQVLLGDWYCSGNLAVSIGGETLPLDSSDIDYHFRGMGATEDNCTLVFSSGHKCCFTLSDKSFKLSWSFDNSTNEFMTSFGPFSIKGHLALLEKDRLVLVYSRSDLFMMMWYLCSSEGRKHIKSLSKCLGNNKLLTVGIEFGRKH